jgi:serine/threonine protein kinase
MNYGIMDEREKSSIVSEVNILRELNHPHIVRYYERLIDKSNGRIYIVMEHLEGGDMRTLIQEARKAGKYFSEEWIWKFFTQVE